MIHPSKPADSQAVPESPATTAAQHPLPVPGCRVGCRRCGGELYSLDDWGCPEHVQCDACGHVQLRYRPMFMEAR